MKHIRPCEQNTTRFFVPNFAGRKHERAYWSAFARLVYIPAILFILLIDSSVWAQDLTASWYSIQSLKNEGTYKQSKGIMANGEQFKDEGHTAASWDYPLNSYVRVTDKATGKSIIVKITDRTARRFKGKRIDLSSGAFQRLASLQEGLIEVKVEQIHRKAR
jgi:rare lipoprotein A (peptidoglycan hydrolase)